MPLPMPGAKPKAPAGAPRPVAAAAAAAAAAQPTPAPGVVPSTPGRKVKFRHPDTGEEHEGHVHAAGAAGATIVGPDGTTHKVTHGNYHHTDGPQSPEEAPKPQADLVRAAAQKHLELGPEAPLCIYGCAALLAAGGLEHPHAHELEAKDFQITSGGMARFPQDKLQTDDKSVVDMLRKLAAANPKGPIFRIKGQPITPENLTAYVQRFGKPTGSPGPDAAAAGAPPAAASMPPMAKGRTSDGRWIWPLVKAAVGALDIPTAPQILSRWEVNGFTCYFRKGRHGIGMVTIEGPDMPLPLHELVHNVSDAKKFAGEAIPMIRAGRAPEKGIYQAFRAPI